MGINFGEIGKRTSVKATRNISTVYRGRALETKGSVVVKYIVQERGWQKRPDKTEIAIQPPFESNVVLTKKAAEEGFLPKVIGFFVSPQTYRIGLDSKIFLYGSISDSYKFQIDGMPFIGKFASRSTRLSTWHISLYTKDWSLLGEMNGSRLRSHEDLKTAQQFIIMARPFSSTDE
jgi:hypothetical protein